ncbi:MAG: type II toxin-antitoxin system RelE/ParE family toxin [Phycisphaeraceae bacterium]|nr:type II toxin-antitoxin system RelE/ParE family toxin [Phycisphaeraceae bacterium]
MYNIEITANAERDIRKLSGSVKRRALEIMDNELSNFPTVTALKPLQGPEYGLGCWRKRFRNVWRMCFLVDDERNIITVFKVSHRDKTYR